MKLRNKVLIGVSLIWVLFLIVTYGGSQYFLTRSILKLEIEHANKDLSRIDEALNQLNHSLYTFSYDWAHWNEAYDYLQGTNPSFALNNLVMSTYVNSNINFLSYWDNQENLVVGASIDTDHHKFIPYPKGIEKHIHPIALLLKKETNKDIRGYISTENGIMMIAAIPVTDSNQAKTSNGILFTGRLLSPTIIKKITEITQLDISLVPPAQELLTPHFNQPISNDKLEGFTLIRDIYGKPIAMVRMIIPRTIYLTGQEAIHYYLICFVILGIIFSFMMIVLISNLLIKRLEYLDNTIAEIGSEKELSKRVKIQGNDELSSVSKQINAMLNIIENSQTQLEQRVQERTQELKQTNVQLEQEITERKSAEQELIIHKEHLVRLAHYDSLTSLPNRVFFNEMLNKSIGHNSRFNQSLAILFIDLDRFKKINDALGHTIGDKVLKEIATRFSTVIRSRDILARLGGDEFIVMLNDISDATSVNPIAEKLLKICSEPVKINNHEFFITTSIGICIYPTDGSSLEDLQKNADIAMYKAKRSGGNKYQYYAQEMNREAHEQIKLESALRKALQNNEFILHYQPKFTLSDGFIVGVEALVRWDSPEFGLVSPSKFIPVAEETGLIMELGEWVLREACRANKSWQVQGFQPITIAVNLSAKQFHHHDITKLVESILSETQLHPHYLELEITETAVMDDAPNAISKLNEISKMGVTIAIDDFGAGYTSISYLKEFPIHTIKIDQSFIKNIPQNQNDMSITSGIIALAHSLNVKVVGEGVETAEQLQFLADHHCDIVQGYYLSRPLTEGKLLIQLTKIELMDS